MAFRLVVALVGISGVIMFHEIRSQEGFNLYHTKRGHHVNVRQVDSNERSFRFYSLAATPESPDGDERDRDAR